MEGVVMWRKAKHAYVRGRRTREQATQKLTMKAEYRSTLPLTPNRGGMSWVLNLHKLFVSLWPTSIFS
eukprot:scaffold379767_cov59-Attheya_sp.AAC.5